LFNLSSSIASIWATEGGNPGDTAKVLGNHV
jgi:hypothetical protein